MPEAVTIEEVQVGRPFQNPLRCYSSGERLVGVADSEGGRPGFNSGRRPDIGSGQRPDRAAIESALRAVVGRHPHVLVAAMVGEGAPALVAVPESVPVPRSSVIPPSAQVAEVVPTDLGVVAAIWLRARFRGLSVGRIRLHRDPEHHGELHGFDLRTGHGVVILAYVPAEAITAEATPDDLYLSDEGARPSVVTKDQRGLITGVDEHFSTVMGWLPAEVVGHQTAEFVHPDDVDLAVDAWGSMLSRPGPGPRLRIRHRHRQGHWVWVDVINENRLIDPAHGDVRTELLDVSEETATIEALQGRERLFSQVAETVPVGLFAASSDGRLLFVNHRLEDLTGFKAADSLDRQFGHLDSSHLERFRSAVSAASDGAESTVDVTFGLPEARVRHCSVALRPLTDVGGTVMGLTGCISDITDIVASRVALETQASSDPLTGCANRTATVAALEAALSRLGDETGAGATLAGVAVLFLDIDDLKTVNDRHGHAAGDRLLIAVAERIRASFRSDDVVGRYGGDEFVVVCAGVPNPTMALTLGRGVLAKVTQPIDLGLATPGPVDPTGASVGVAWTSRHGVSASQMVHLADQAMYASKRAEIKEPVLTQFGDPTRIGVVRHT